MTPDPAHGSDSLPLLADIEPVEVLEDALVRVRRWLRDDATRVMLVIDCYLCLALGLNSVDDRYRVSGVDVKTGLWCVFETGGERLCRDTFVVKVRVFGLRFTSETAPNLAVSQPLKLTLSSIQSLSHGPVG
ncbi:hypothetical protein [Haloarcula marismortui]|uniref:Uncharacterized protein n=1 Tax=Haloarcula marismortui ATCC 33799 TaxID=662475 RepID=M0K9Z6_9EURY|nr:hypothetical protein [Haloarcula californiae]EMA17623.1 hypothetical protein C435_10724 [Haloarcula californiae ATCC 33799]